jgi:DNA-binding CsgD family transcriptional regulator
LPHKTYEGLGVAIALPVTTRTGVSPNPLQITGAPSVQAMVTASNVALNALSIPAFVLRPDSEILESNQAGQDLLRVSRAFRRHQNRLSIRRAADASAMAEAISRVAVTGEPELIRFLTRQEEASALMRLQPVPGESLVVVCITELRASMLLAGGWSKAAFGFSPQNAALAESLALGHSLADFAAAENLPIGTVRTRLKKLLTQTGMSSQASLAAILLRASAVMSGAETLKSLPNGRK